MDELRILVTVKAVLAGGGNEGIHHSFVEGRESVSISQLLKEAPIIHRPHERLPYPISFRSKKIGIQFDEVVSGFSSFPGELYHLPRHVNP